MANAVTAYRDTQLSERNPDASIAAILAYLEGSAPQPLPPLAPTRRRGSQHLPPVRNLLHHPDDWQQQKEDGLQDDGTSGKVCMRREDV